MAYYLVSARPVADRMDDLESKLSQQAFRELSPFGRALNSSLERARRLPDGTAVWEEEDYCRPPLAQERVAVLDLRDPRLAFEDAEGIRFRDVLPARVAGIQDKPALAARDQPVLGLREWSLLVHTSGSQPSRYRVGCRRVRPA